MMISERDRRLLELQTVPPRYGRSPGMIPDLPESTALRNMAFKLAADEEIIRSLLSRWVSELEPAVAYRDGEIIGLTIADAPIGSEPFVLRR